MTRRLRHVIHIPTNSMLADQLTKKMTSDIFMRFATTGVWAIKLNNNSAVRIRRALRRPATYTERQLEDNQFEQATTTTGLGEPLDLGDDFWLAIDTAGLDDTTTTNYYH